MTALLLAGRTTLQSLIVDVSEEYCLLLMAALFGSYSLIGGIGTTFYVSYFNMCMAFTVLTVFFTNILYDNTSFFPNLGDISKIYSIVSRVEGSNGNNLMSFRSESGLVFGIVGFFLASSMVYCNQASWQNRIAAKPMEGVLGFILAGFMWLSIPSTLGNTTGMAYLTLSAENGTHLLTTDQINQGLVTPLIAEKVLGRAGGIMVLCMISMALMSTGSGEVMAVSSIIVYDIYQIYIRPLRMYQDYLIDFKNWCIIWVAIAMIPFGLIIFSSGIDLNWTFFVGAIAIIPAFPAVALAVMWVKLTSEGIIAGGITGLLAGIAVTLTAASRYEGGLSNFTINTSQDFSILAGCCFSFGISLAVCVVVSALTHKIKAKADADAEWQKIYGIDNPLNPWEQNYREELKGQQYDKKPSFDQMAAAFRREKKIAYISGGSITVLFTFIIPAIMLSFPVIDETQFKTWIMLTQAWTVFMGIIAIVAPPVEEYLKIRKQRRKNKTYVVDTTVAGNSKVIAIM
ncbi:Urea-proton symporter DUR3 [Mizuhopecten yessoensis]|uniref:Urea-proton symporter DUR3 n=1 Tax=Mizuhopecten yessoensis TaxID=6573 RepID=A0A210Q8R1_MIZYE|nr:Urea-proton symporter DUR3 [Mizuhopecten yessoensis]